MEKIRLQKFLADAGLMSRRSAEDEIERANVSVNGHVASVGTKIDPRADVVAYKGKRVRYEKKQYTYIMLNKPRGYLSSTTDDRGRKCVTDLLDGVDACLAIENNLWWQCGCNLPVDITRRGEYNEYTYKQIL